MRWADREADSTGFKACTITEKPRIDWALSSQIYFKKQEITMHGRNHVFISS